MTPPQQVTIRASVNNAIRKDNSENKNTEERNGEASFQFLGSRKVGCSD
jgi:hypothetical protein